MCLTNSFTKPTNTPAQTKAITLSNQLDLFPTSEPEIKGQLVAFALVLRGPLETLIANGSLTREQAVTLLRETDVKAAFAVWDELQGEMPDAEVKRMEEQA